MSRINVPFAAPVEEPPTTSVAPSAAPTAAPKGGGSALGRQHTAAGTPQFLWWVDVIVIAALMGVAYGLVIAASHWTAPLTPNTPITLSPLALPVYAGLSTLRMALAYVLSLAFSLIYARIAASVRPAEAVMVPLLDILQSIPILSFLPVVILGLIALFPHSNFGLELAAVLLIFTSQAWNMTFSFYHSLLIIPRELREAASIYRLNTWQRFRRLELPFGMIPLIWNSMMSWAGGWFFLLAAEQFTLGRTHNFRLPGLGSYLQTAANEDNVGALLLGLLTLVIVIVLLDQFLWRPLIAWADRFKLEQTSSGVPPRSFVLRALRHSALVDTFNRRVTVPAMEVVDRLSSRLLPDPYHASEAEIAATPAPSTLGSGWWKRVVAVVLLAAALVLVGFGVVSALQKLLQVPPGEWLVILESAGATLLRTLAALIIGVAWTVPLGVAIGQNPRLARRAQPLVQLVASIPATALFPALLLILLGLPGGLDIAAVALMLLGTQWYMLFNVIAGAMSIPTDLREAGAIYQLRGWRRWRVLILPAIFPALITGAITATGGAWNASVVSEYVSFGNHTYSTVGLGALIAQAVNGNNYSLLLAATLTMAAVVVTINRLVWRPLYRLAEQRFHLD
jgi:NitT/TauT family transport system permease protein